MPRTSRVLSFMTQWGHKDGSPPPDGPIKGSREESHETPVRSQPANIDTITPQQSRSKVDILGIGSPNFTESPSNVTPSRARGDSRATTRPSSMIQSYQPPQMEVAQDTPPELAPIFSFLNSHSNKLYQEGYFLKLHDLDSRGRPSADRTWAECFAQLVGTVLSLWDAAALDVAGEDGEVVPTFINLSDASIKMIESLPMSGVQGGSLQNVLSISTAANNRYLLHFNSYNSLTQWTAGIRLAMFEHATLQEAYTGSLIAGKGRVLNNIKAIMDRSKFAHEDWARVRFGAGTPWKRCWCVVTPPDEKEYQKAQKNIKKSSYDRPVKVPKGDIKFYDTRKVTKKTKPIATITDAYAAYAIYPQSKPLIDQSTLVKLEGLVTIHTTPETTTEGFVFVMPEVHAAVTGFEMMLRWLFPVFDAFALYGRPTRLIADVLDQRGLMFAMPRDRRYGYLENLDVSGLIHTTGSPAWSERQWRREMKKLTGERMTAQLERGGLGERNSSQQRHSMASRTSMSHAPGAVRFDDGAFDGSGPPSRSASPMPRNPMTGQLAAPRRIDSAPPLSGSMSPHKRSASDVQGYRKYMAETPSRLSQDGIRYDDELAPPPPRHGAGSVSPGRTRPSGPGALERILSEAEIPTISSTFADVTSQTANPMYPPLPVDTPPAFIHNPNTQPAIRPTVAPELRRAHSNVDAATLYQMQDAARRDRTPDEDYGNEQHNRVGLTPLADRSVNSSADRLQGLVKGANAYNDSHNSGQMIDDDRRDGYKHGVEDQQPSAYGNEASHANRAADASYLDAAGGYQTPQSRGPSPSVLSGQSVARKPVPGRLTERPRDFSEEIPAPGVQLSEIASEPSSRHESLDGALIDQDALELILSADRAGTMHSEASSIPDYASTVSSHHEPKKSTERPRAGKLKTVGNPEIAPGDPRVGKLDTWQADLAAESAEMPSIDFGPTPAYRPSGRPGTSGTITPGEVLSQSRSGSQDRLRSSGRLTPSGVSPNDNRRSYFGANTTPSPGATTPSGAMERRSSVAWTPAGTSPGRSNRNSQSLTPEQWVAHRASLAAVPQQAPRGATPPYMHNRVASGSALNLQQKRQSLNKTPPPFARTYSGDWTAQPGQQTPPSRPGSRGASSHLNPLTSAQQAANLSAREQMHVARATGTPLLDMSNNTIKQRQQDEALPGLVGAIGAREREKAALNKAGSNRSSMVVENAIRARQQAQAQAENERAVQAHLQAQQQAAQQAAMAYQQQQQQAQYAQSMAMQPQQQQQRPMLQTQPSSYYGPPPGQQQQYAQASPSSVYSPAAPSGGYASPYQAQQQQMMAQQGGSNRQSWYGGSYFGGQAGGQQQQQQGRR
ncbi:hypothetical protein B0A48_18107 [Cryoendolithus antarcticus]|uniref:PH domain-containing protein n=1 Tax=Cryoendolithus antarcticus TaxID=1507870 RepID=A0A1V8S9L9_9PEZI|nr:hypothetical protein B0A48_18107 [Cryoendolithus antarcticus]